MLMAGRPAELAIERVRLLGGELGHARDPYPLEVRNRRPANRAEVTEAARFSVTAAPLVRAH